MAFERELAAVHGWLDATDEIALRHFHPGVRVETKPDGSPVTEADRAIEASLRRAIAADFPGDAILGEEEGETFGGDRRWIVDPIDATKNYARGIPIFGTLVALEHEGRLSAAVVTAPAIRTRWWATAGDGAYRDGSRIRVSPVSALEEAHVASTNLRHAVTTGYADALTALAGRVARTRGFNDFWGYMLVAQGSAEIAAEFPGLGPWDLAAPKLIVHEAGGRLTSLSGEDTYAAGDALATNGLLHDEVLDLLRASRA